MRVFEAADYESAVRLGKFNIPVKCNGQNFEKIPIF